MFTCSATLQGRASLQQEILEDASQFSPSQEAEERPVRTKHGDKHPDARAEQAHPDTARIRPRPRRSRASVPLHVAAAVVDPGRPDDAREQGQQRPGHGGHEREEHPERFQKDQAGYVADGSQGKQPFSVVFVACDSEREDR